MISPETLRRFPFFAGIEPELFKDIAMTGEEVTLLAGNWLFKEGDEADAFYLILSGGVELKIAIDEASGRYGSLDQAIDGDFLGWSALVEPHMYTLGAQAVTDARLVKLEAEGLRDLMSQHHEMGCRLMLRLAQGIGKRLTNLRIRFVSLSE